MHLITELALPVNSLPQKNAISGNESNHAAVAVGDGGPSLRVRVDRRLRTARYVIDIRDRDTRISLRGDSHPLTADDESLLADGEFVAESWLAHTRLPLKRRPLFPVRRLPPPSRDREHRKRVRYCDSRIAA